MSDSLLFCFGYGYTARQIARRLMPRGWRIMGTTRSAEKAEAMRADGVEPILIGGEATPISEAAQANAILISAAPGENGCPAFAALAEPLAQNAQSIDWIGYLSSNGVYGDHGGAWVDEDAALKPTSARAKRRVRAEADWAAHGVAYSLPVVIFRLPGIYGPGRSALDTVRAGKAKRIVKPGQVFSRAHVEDIATVLEASLANPSAGDLFNIADDEPSPPHEVIEYACSLLGVDPPPLQSLDEAEMSDMARSFYADNKRVRNNLIKEALGVSLQYPNYRVGLEAIFQAEIKA